MREMTTNIVITGFGGQGILFIGKIRTAERERAFVAAVLRSGNARRYGKLSRNNLGRTGSVADYPNSGYINKYE